MRNLSMNSRDRVIGRDIDKFELLSKISIVYRIFVFIFTLKGNFKNSSCLPKNVKPKPVWNSGSRQAERHNSDDLLKFYGMCM